MTAIEVRRTYLQCNTCGRRTQLNLNAEEARKAAARVGWKFGRGGKNRTFDACQKCELPVEYVRIKI